MNGRSGELVQVSKRIERILFPRNACSGGELRGLSVPTHRLQRNGLSLFCKSRLKNQKGPLQSRGSLSPCFGRERLRRNTTTWICYEMALTVLVGLSRGRHGWGPDRL